jgi:protein-tyrosine-phosphatase
MDNRIYKYKILFVCTGNVFRSLSAKYLLDEFLKEKGINNVFVDSAGIIAKPQNLIFSVVSELGLLSVDIKDHKQKKLTQEMICNYDLVVAISKNHQKFIKDNFNLNVPLFLEIVKNKKEDIKDNREVLDNLNGWAEDMYNKSIVRKIYRYIPEFYNNFEKFIKK